MSQKIPIYLLLFDCILNTYSMESATNFSKKSADETTAISIIDQGKFSEIKLKAERLNTKCQLEY
ncbi:MAG: hypothetical protein C0397_02515 [Odoribacter sp.]|nr:hypothetical protein [Odoribacter sp.]